MCGSRRLVRILDLGMHPFADTFVPAARLSEPDPAYPLACDLCRTCGHVQAACVTRPDDRYFGRHAYSYTSSNSAFSRRHWTAFARDVLARIALPARAFIVEVGSNDGFLAAQLQRRGHRVLGVDASPFMARLAAGRRVRTNVCLFGKAAATAIRTRHGRADLLIANNVVNHADVPRDFVAGVASLLPPGGWFVFEQPYWLAGIRAGKFDQVYHEHVSYFTLKALQRLLAAAGFTIVDAAEVDHHGGSLRVYARRSRRAESAGPAIRALVRREETAGLFRVRTYETLMVRALRQRSVFLRRLYALKRAGYPIVAVGAPAKGNTILNFYRLDRSVVDYVTDTSPHKRGKFTPLTRIPIVGDAVFRRLRHPRALVLSWNLVHALRPKLLKLNRTIQFLSPEDATP